MYWLTSRYMNDQLCDPMYSHTPRPNVWLYSEIHMAHLLMNFEIYGLSILKNMGNKHPIPNIWSNSKIQCLDKL